MSLDLYLSFQTKVIDGKECLVVPKELLSRLTDYTFDSFEDYHLGNITHNLGRMADQIPVKANVSLYDVLWHPETYKTQSLDELHSLWKVGHEYMCEHEDELLPYEASNGWGTYNGLLNFVNKVIVKSAPFLGNNCKVWSST